MILAVDTSALLFRYAAGRHSDLVLRAMKRHDTWVISELAITELHVALHRLAMNPQQHDLLSARARRDLECFYTVPVDSRCLVEAAEIAENYQLTTSHGIHLAAASRLGQDVGYLTLADAQFGPAEDIGLELAIRTRSERSPDRTAATLTP